MNFLNLDIRNFRYREDYVIESICEKCGEINNGKIEICQNCLSEELSVKTFNENSNCYNCGKKFEKFESNYIDDHYKICTDCYDEAVEEFIQEMD